MRVTKQGLVSAVLVVFVCLGVCGCHGEPRSYTYAELQNPEIRKVAAKKYWLGHGGLRLRDLGSKRVAVAEFSVEFVTRKMQPPMAEPTSREQVEDGMAPPSERQPEPVERKAEADPGLYDRVAEDLYVLFVKQCKQRHIEVVPSKRVLGTFGFREMRKIRGPETQVYQYDSATNPDVGWALETQTVPARGLGIVLGSSWTEAEDSEISLLRETEADVAIRVRLRVGLYQGHATLERGSKIKLVSRESAGVMVAERSVVSSNTVLLYDEVRTIDKRIDRIDPDQFGPTIRRIFPTFVGMAFESSSRQGVAGDARLRH